MPGDGGSDTESPPAKRVNHAAAVVELVGDALQLRERYRSELRNVYSSYGVLVKAASGANTGSEAIAFQGLLDCAGGAQQLVWDVPHDH